MKGIDDEHAGLADCAHFQYCRQGIRLFCKKYGLDYADFRSGKMNILSLEGTGDAMALKIVDYVRNGRNGLK